MKQNIAYDIFLSIVICVLFPAVCYFNGKEIGEQEKQAEVVHWQECFDAAAGLLLLTPDSEKVYQEMIDKVEKCGKE